MIPFKDIAIEDADAINGYLQTVAVPSSDFSFATIFCWRGQYMTQFAVWSGFLLLRFRVDEGWQYMPPIGQGDLRAVLGAMLSDAEERGDNFAIGAVTPEIFASIENALPGKFIFTENRDLFEYIYSAEKLANLTGKNLQAKRNHINQFVTKYPHFTYEFVGNENKHECMEVYDEWKRNYINEHPQTDLKHERDSIMEALLHFERFGLKGLLLKIEGKTVAFAYGEKMGNTFVVHAEKTRPDFRDAYAMVNKLTAERLAADCLYINREEDMGIVSLRIAKLQYHPVNFLRKGIVRTKNIATFEIARAQTSASEGVKQLWHNVFGDETAYIDRFFEKIYKPENTWVATVEGNVAASVQTLPYTMVTNGDQHLQARYLFCVMTDKQFRRHGIMETLINKAIAELRKEGCDLFFLIPADAHIAKYYERFGFRECFDTAVFSWHGTPPSIGAKTPKNIDEIYDFCKNTRGEGVAHTRKQIAFVCETALAEGAEIYATDRHIALVKGNTLLGVIADATTEASLYRTVEQSGGKPLFPKGMALITSERVTYEQLQDIRLKFMYEK